MWEDPTKRPWHSSSFYVWFLDQIDILLATQPTIQIDGATRRLKRRDFGYGDRAIRGWENSGVPSNLPRGKDLLDVVASQGFPCFPEGTQLSIVKLWIQQGVSAGPQSDNLKALLRRLAESADVKFLLKNAREAALL